MDQTPNKPSQLRVGAGLEESRLNQDFLDFLRKWSTPVLLVAALAALGFVAYQKYTQAQRDNVDKAFRELEDVSSTTLPSPDSLTAVARQYPGINAVPALAHIRAGDSLMFGIQTGLKAGAKIKPDGTPEQADDVLADADRTSILAQAAENYQLALDESMKNASQRSVTFGALFGLASVAESKGEIDQAKTLYERIIALADADPVVANEDGTPGEHPFANHAVIAKERIAKLGSLSKPIPLVSESQLPKLPPLPGEVPAATGLPEGVTVTPVSGPQFTSPPANPSTPPAGPSPAPTAPPATPDPAAPPAAPK